MLLSKYNLRIAPFCQLKLSPIGFAARDLENVRIDGVKMGRCWCRGRCRGRVVIRVDVDVETSSSSFPSVISTTEFFCLQL